MSTRTPTHPASSNRPCGPTGPVARGMAAALVSAVVVAASCGGGIGPVEGEPIPPLAELDFGRVSPALSYDLWELRSSMEGVADAVIGEGGTEARSEIDPDLLAAFDATTVSSGFGAGCLPGSCFLYFAGLAGAEIETAATAEEAVRFLGSIGSGEEAALVVAAHGYHWGRERETGSVRRDGDGYELVVLRTVEFCAPVRTDRFRLHVSGSGQLSVRDREVWRRDDGACI